MLVWYSMTQIVRESTTTKWSWSVGRGGIWNVCFWDARTLERGLFVSVFVGCNNEQDREVKKDLCTIRPVSCVYTGQSCVVLPWKILLEQIFLFYAPETERTIPVVLHHILVLGVYILYLVMRHESSASSSYDSESCLLDAGCSVPVQVQT